MTLDTCFTGAPRYERSLCGSPFPKYDADQKEYLTGMMDNYSIMGIPTDAANPDMSSAVAEALNIEAERIMYPVWYDESLSTKFQRDEYTVKYLDLLIAGRKADMGTLFRRASAESPCCSETPSAQSRTASRAAGTGTRMLSTLR